MSLSAWLGEEGVEIKKQITGMMRLLSDKAGRVYQRVGREGETLKEEPQEEDLSWNLSHKQDTQEAEHGWNSVSHAQYDTRSKTQKVLDQGKSRGGSHSRGRCVKVRWLEDLEYALRS